MRKLFYIFCNCMIILLLASCESNEPSDSSNEQSVPEVPSTPETPEEPQEPNIPEIPSNPSQPTDETLVFKPFSVSATKTVTFSPGNLQYHPVNDEWRFAPSQLEYIGKNNANISSTYNGWIDLFGWGTGKNPTTNTETYKDYSIFVDWGVNKIGNYKPNNWRTLTEDEWVYLLWKRPDYYKLKAVAQVDGVNGLILLPDNWVCPINVTFKYGTHMELGKTQYADFQTISASDWSLLEKSGAVFLPSSGRRQISALGFVEHYGYYWSSTDYGANAYYLYITSKGGDTKIGAQFYGKSVRLVMDN